MALVWVSMWCAGFDHVAATRTRDESRVESFIGYAVRVQATVDPTDVLFSIDLGRALHAYRGVQLP